MTLWGNVTQEDKVIDALPRCMQGVHILTLGLM